MVVTSGTWVGRHGVHDDRPVAGVEVVDEDRMVEGVNHVAVGMPSERARYDPTMAWQTCDHEGGGLDSLRPSEVVQVRDIPRTVPARTGRVEMNQRRGKEAVGCTTL